MRTLVASLLLLSATAAAQELPPPLSASDLPPALTSKDVPRARSPLLAQPSPAPPSPAKPAAKPAAAMVVLAGGWTDADSRAAAAALARECAGGAWIARYRREHGTAPRLKLLPVRNRALLANLAPLGRGLEAGLGALVARGAPANVVLTGTLQTLNDAAQGKELQSFLLALSAIDLESGEKLWLGIHRVRKLVEARGTEVRVRALPLGQPLDLSGNFNDADADQLGQALLRDLLASRLLARTPPPVLRFSSIRNRTTDAVRTSFLSALLEQGVLRSGRARVATSLEEASDLEAELAGQVATAARPPRVGARLAATHLVSGILTLLASATPDGELRAYTLALQATSVDQARKEWLKTASVKKLIARR